MSIYMYICYTISDDKNALPGVRGAVLCWYPLFGTAVGFLARGRGLDKLPIRCMRMNSVLVLGHFFSPAIHTWDK